MFAVDVQICLMSLVVPQTYRQQVCSVVRNAVDTQQQNEQYCNSRMLTLSGSANDLRLLDYHCLDVFDSPALTGIVMLQNTSLRVLTKTSMGCLTTMTSPFSSQPCDWATACTQIGMSAR